MSVIINLYLKDKIYDLEENIIRLKLLNDLSTFRIIFNDCMKIMLSISYQIKNRNDFVQKKIPIDLFKDVISFLPYNQIIACRSVCSYWLMDLRTTKLERTLLSSAPKIIYPHSLLKLDFEPKKMIKIKDNIYVTNYFDVCKINMRNFKLSVGNRMSSYLRLGCSNGNNMVCYSELGGLNIISPKLITRIQVKKIQAMAIDDANVYIAICDSLNIYNLKGHLINSWKLINNAHNENRIRRIVVNKDKIYMVDSAFNCIRKFSLEGKLIKSWGKSGTEPGNFNYPQGITIYKDFIFIVDSGNIRIQVFNLNGNFISEHVHNSRLCISNIVIENDYLLVI